MPLKIYTIPLEKLSSMSSLFLTTRVLSYQKSRISNSQNLSYFLDGKNTFTLGQIKREDYETSGEFPIIDQSQEFIAGYSDEEESVYTGTLPVIVFGDHTRIFKYVDFPFIQGADGIKVLRPDESKVNPKFFYYLLEHTGVPSRGYNRHFSILKEQRYPDIPLPLQNSIVAEIEPIEERIAELKSQIVPASDIINRVFAREFGFDLRKFEEVKNDRFFFSDLSIFGKQNDIRFSVKHSRYSQYLNELKLQYPFIQFQDILLENPQYGANESGKDYEEGDPRYIRITDIDDIGNLMDVDKKSAEKSDEKYLLKNNDFLFARSGNTVGKSFLYNSEIHPEAIFAGYFIKFVFDKEIINPLFLLYYSKSLIFETWKNSIMRTMGQPNINAEEYKTLPILNISLTEQQRIVDEIRAELDAQKVTEDAIASERMNIDAIIERVINQ